MATTKTAPAPAQRQRVAWLVLAGLLLGVVALLVWNLWPPPQMGADEDVFREVDALFTAVTSRNEKLLGDCEQRLHTLKAAGKLPPSPAAYLDGIIRTARAGGWDSAAPRLYDFMKAQRRDEAGLPPPKKPKKQASAK